MESLNNVQLVSVGIIIPLLCAGFWALAWFLMRSIKNGQRMWAINFVACMAVLALYFAYAFIAGDVWNNVSDTRMHLLIGATIWGGYGFSFALFSVIRTLRRTKHRRKGEPTLDEVKAA